MRKLKTHPEIIIMPKDWQGTLSQAEKHPSIKYLTFAMQTSWMQVWDYTLDCGSTGTNRVLVVLKLLSAPVYGGREKHKIKFPLICVMK